MYKFKRSNILIICLLLLLSSCEKEISINLNKSNPRIVIEGSISNIAGESNVKITRTLNFDETIAFPTVGGALVTITDTLLNKTDTLTELKSGIYNDSTLFGKEGHIYKLQVKIANEIYTSLSTMPNSFLFDSIVKMPDLGGPKPPAGTPGADNIPFKPSYKNKTKADKYFQYVITRNDSLQNKITVRSDMAASGFSFPIPFSIQARKNDVLNIDIQFIDKTVYEFLNELNANIGQFSATPSNPASNISNGALGFFKAHTSQKFKLIVK
ncbi:MAG: DUF4249 family protein [Paludibacter sp.]